MFDVKILRNDNMVEFENHKTASKSGFKYKIYPCHGSKTAANVIMDDARSLRRDSSWIVIHIIATEPRIHGIPILFQF